MKLYPSFFCELREADPKFAIDGGCGPFSGL